MISFLVFIVGSALVWCPGLVAEIKQQQSFGFKVLAGRF